MEKKTKKKLYATRTVKLGCFFLALILSIGILQGYLLRRLDHNSIRLDGFYLEEKGSLDVVFLGASEMYTGISAGYAYEKYGFTSFPYATESITADGTMLALKEILRTQDPQLIVIDPNAYLYGFDSNETHEGHIHKLVDNIPLSENKIDYITNHVSSDQWLEYYMPLIKYHSIWSEYPDPIRRVVSKVKQDIRGTSYLKGFRTTTKIFKPDQELEKYKPIQENGKIELQPTLDKKYRELLQFCKDKDLKVVFMRTPHVVDKTTRNRAKRTNRAAEIANEYGFDFINVEHDIDKTGIDLYNDFYNLDHMNIYGTVKMTDYIGNILTTKYGVKGKELSEKNKENLEKSAKCFDQLYKYCDYLIKEKKEMVQIEEDVNTLSEISKY